MFDSRPLAGRSLGLHTVSPGRLHNALVRQTGTCCNNMHQKEDRAGDRAGGRVWQDFITPQGVHRGYSRHRQTGATIGWTFTFTRGQTLQNTHPGHIPPFRRGHPLQTPTSVTSCHWIHSQYFQPHDTPVAQGAVHVMFFGVCGFC